MPFQKEAARVVERPYSRPAELPKRHFQIGRGRRECWCGAFHRIVRLLPHWQGYNGERTGVELVELRRADLVSDVQTSRRNASSVDPEPPAAPRRVGVRT